MQEQFEKTFVLKNYNVTVTQSSIVFFQDKAFIRVHSEFRNRYDERSGRVIIKNIYLRFNALFTHEYETMFDAIAYIFDIKKHLTINQ